MRVLTALLLLAISTPAMSNDIAHCPKKMTATLKLIDHHQNISDLLLKSEIPHKDQLTAVKNQLEKDIDNSCNEILDAVTDKDLPGTCTYESNDKMKLSSIYLFEKLCQIFR